MAVVLVAAEGAQLHGGPMHAEVPGTKSSCMSHESQPNDKNYLEVAFSDTALLNSHETRFETRLQVAFQSSVSVPKWFSSLPVFCPQLFYFQFLLALSLPHPLPPLEFSVR